MAVIEQQITNTLESNYMPYAMSVIVSRAIPEIDGFKPSHRKLLYTMYKMGLLKGARTKSANVVGQTMKLNPHGDQAIYATMVRLSRGYDALLHPYVDSKGNFGKSTSRDMAYAASRYTEVKLDAICTELFKDIDKNTVDMVDNYDGTMKEPTLLPTTFPNILVNANRGIAVGMASNIASFNLREVCETTIKYIDHPGMDLLKTLKAPDFSTGGKLIYSKSALNKIYKTGVGSVKLRARFRYLADENMIEITEIPYTTTIEAIIDKIVDLVKSQKVKEISDVRDEMDLKGLKITLDLKRGADPELVMGKLYRYTTLEDSFSCNFNMLIDGKPRVMGIKTILDEWLRFRKNTIIRALDYDVKDMSAKLHLLKGLEAVLLDLDEAIAIIRRTKEDKAVVPELMRHFEIDEKQAEFVANLRLRNINQEYILQKTSEKKALEDAIEEKKMIMASDEKIKAVIKEELKVVSKKFGTDRRTEIVTKEEIIEHDEEDHIEDYNLKVFVTDHNYFKKISLVSLRASGSHRLKEEDEIIMECEGSNKDEILFFTDQCQVYKRMLYELPDHKASGLGAYLPNVLEMDEGENVLYAVVTNDFKGHMIFAYENGKVSKVPLDSYETKFNRKKLVNAYSDQSPVIGVRYIREESDFVLVRYAHPDEYRFVLFNTALVNTKSTRNARGVQVVRLKKDSEVIKLIDAEDFRVADPASYKVPSIPRSGKELEDPAEKMKIAEIIG